MTRRPWFFPCAVLLLAGLAALPACKKKSTNTDSGGDPAPAPGPTSTPSGSSVATDPVLFAHLRVSEIRDSEVLAEVKAAIVKAGAAADWDEFDAKPIKEIGVKFTDLDSVTVHVNDVPGSKEPKVCLILAANKPINKANVLKQGTIKPDNRGMHKVGGGGLLHFPDEKTLVMVHPDLAQNYLDGYAKSRTGWPMTAEFTKAAAGHTLYAVARPNALPKELTRQLPLEQFGSLLSAKKVAVSADLKGKELNLAARATFSSPAAATQAQTSVKELIGMANSMIDLVANGKEGKEYAVFMPAALEAKRALNDAKIDVSGSDLVVSGSYKADFDIGAIAVAAVKLVGETDSRNSTLNSLRQIGLALHNFESANGQLPVHAVGANGTPLRTANDKPLLSWRVALLPYMEQENLYNQFKLNEPWDSPNNKKLIEQMPKIYASGKAGKPGYTHLQMIIGPNAMSPAGTRLLSITDGTSNTIAVVEAANPVIWTKPDDVMLTGNVLPKDLKKKFGGLQPGGFNAVMWDGSVRFIKDTIDDRILGLLLNPKDGQVIPPGAW